MHMIEDYLVLFDILYQPLKCGDRIIPVQHSQYHGCWCSGSLRHQEISTHYIDYVK